VLRPAVSYSGGEKPAISRPNQATESVSRTDGNTGSFQAKSNSNSASTNSVTGSATTYKEEQINVDVSDNNTEDQPKAVIYIRVSSKRQAEEGISLEAQETNCTNYGRMKSYNIVKVFVDDGVSATKHLWTRPAGKAMKDYIQNHGIKPILYR